jgi:predicted dehydrogenase
LVEYRAGDVFIPMINSKEALSGMASDFLNSIINKTTPLSSFQSGLDVIKILEASQLSIKQHGKEILIK